MPKIHKPAGTPGFKTPEECDAWIADRVARWTVVLRNGALTKVNFTVKNTKHPDFKPEGVDEPLKNVVKPKRDSQTKLWFAYVPVDIVA